MRYGKTECSRKISLITHDGKELSRLGEFTKGLVVNDSMLNSELFHR